MNKIKNTMCRLRDLTQEQIDILVAAMPNSPFFEAHRKIQGISKIGFSGPSAGFWHGVSSDTIVTYAGMMQLLKGKDMNKQTAQEQIAVMQIEMDKLKAIIDKPEAKTGRVLSKDDLDCGAYYWFLRAEVCNTIMDNDMVDKKRIDMGSAFHDKETAERHLEYLKLEQELRRAQAADGGEGKSVITIRYGNIINDDHIVNHTKISFKTCTARDRFRNTHTEDQLTLLIRGV
jgi:hypothetical protein